MIKFPQIALTITEPVVSDETCPACGQATQVAVSREVTTQECLALALMDFSAQGGPTAGELAVRLPIRNKIVEAKGKSVLLENSEWGILKPAVEKFRWPWTHADVLTVRDAVINAEEREATTAKKVPTQL